MRWIRKKNLSVTLFTLTVAYGNLACLHRDDMARPSDALPHDDLADVTMDDKETDFTLDRDERLAPGNLRFYAEDFSRELYEKITSTDDERAKRIAMVNERNMGDLFPEQEEEINLPSMPAGPRAMPPNETPGKEAAAPRTRVNVRVIFYVKNLAAPVRTAASPLGSLQRTLPRGTPVLVEVQGAWAKLEDGKFIAMDDLSPQPQKGMKSEAQWQTRRRRP